MEYHRMVITAIQIRRIENSGTKMHGIANITLDEMIAIHDIKLLKNNTTMFLAMPSRPAKPNTFKDVVHPINSDVRQVFERLIFAAYEMADNMNYSLLELVLKDEKKDSHFFDLSIKDYNMGRISTAVIQQTGSVNNTCNATKKQHEKQLENRIDDDLLKWLEGQGEMG